MIPVVTHGTSFKGCVAYHSHDKRAEGETERLTSDRVAWTHTRNLPTDDLAKAWRIMAWTAEHAKQLKAAAGEKLTGNRCKQPVYSLVLAWDPSQSPTKADMLKAADGALKALKLDGRQAIVFCHVDEPQPHIHVVVNKVCHLTGRAPDLRRDWLKLSTWAERYERETGQLLCELRVNHNARRARGEFVKNDNLTRKEYEIVKRYMTMTPERIRDERRAVQDDDRRSFEHRQRHRRMRFEADLDSLYGAARRQTVKAISELEARRDLSGLFASIVRFKDRLTGAVARREREIKALRATLANLDMRIIEQRAAFERENAAHMVKLANRQKTERERDERLIAHARGRTERERMRLKARMNFKVRGDADPRHVPQNKHREQLSKDLGAAARDSGPGLLDRLIRSIGGPADTGSRNQTLGRDVAKDQGDGPPREKRWTRAEGRGANRTPGRTRHRKR